MQLLFAAGALEDKKDNRQSNSLVMAYKRSDPMDDKKKKQLEE